MTRHLPGQLHVLILASITGFAVADEPLPYKNYAPAWSPDGQRIAFYSTRDGDWEIYVVHADGSHLTRLTDSPGYDGEPAWSPDGSRLAFASARDGDTEIYIMAADGSNVIQITSNDVADDDPAWSPTGNTIIHRRQVHDQWRVFIMSAEGSGNRQLSPLSSSGRVRWSPDGSEIAFVTEYGDRQAIQRITSDGEPLDMVFTRHDYPGNPAYSPDGERLIYDAHADGGGASGDGNWELWSVALDGSRPRRITMNDTDDWGARWSPDGTKIVYCGGGRVNRGYEIEVMNASGTAIKRLTSATD